MTLCSQYRILPFPIACDTILLCCNPYFDVRLQQCYSVNDLSSLIKQAPPSHRIVLLADTFESGTQLLQKLNKLQKQSQREALEDSDSFQKYDKDELLNDQLSLLGNQLAQSSKHRSSFLHLHCLLNSAQQKINTITSQIKHRQGQNKAKLSKKEQKQQKQHQKQLQQLKRSRGLLQKRQEGLQKQIRNEEDLLWWKEQCIKNPLVQQNEEQSSSCEDLLSDSQQKKENRLQL